MRAFSDDVDRILTDLHYKTANLVGISYGVTAEQVFLIRHPARVRTMTLLSGTLLTVPVFEQMPRATQQALDAVFTECATDPACHGAFPNLPAEWASVWAGLQAHPWVVPANRAPDHVEHVFDADWFAGEIHQLLFVATTQADIPVLIHTIAVATDPVSALLAIAAAMPATPSPTPSPATSAASPATSPAASPSVGTDQMLPFATQCSEPWALRDPSRLVDTTSFEYHADLASAQLWQYECGLIPDVAQSYDVSKLADAHVAVLAFNGTADPQDPPVNLAGAKALWPNSALLQVPGQGHDIDAQSGSCEVPIIQSFIEQGSPAHLDTNCLARLAARTFPTTLAAAASSS